MQGKAIRALRVALVVLAVGAVLVLAQREGATASALVLAGLAIAGFVWWWWRLPDIAGTVASLVVTCLLTSEITYTVGVQLAGVSPLQLGLAFWLFAGVCAVTAWVTPRHRGNRAVTVVLAHAILVATSLLAYFSTAVLPIAGLIAALTVVVWRSRQRRWPPRGRAKGAELDGRTADELAKLGDDWALYGDLLSGPSGNYLITVAEWSGRMELTAAKQYVLAGDPQLLSAKLRPILSKTRRFTVKQGFRPDELTGLVVFWDDTTLPGGVVELTVYDAARRRRTGTRLALVRGEKLLTWLRKRQPVSSPGRR